MRSAFQQLSEGEAVVQQAGPDAATLAELVAWQRQRVEQQLPCGAERCGELTADENILEVLLGLLQRAAPEALPRPHTPLQAARELADPFPLSVPPSHRGRLGLAVTATKRLFVEGLRPFHIELLRPQQAFNHKLLGVLEQLSVHRMLGLRSELGPWVARQLEAEAVPFHWRVHSHRRGAAGTAVALAKRSYLRVLEPLLRQALEGQQRFNQSLVQVLVELSGPGRLPPAELEQRVASLQALAEPLPAAGRPAWLRATSPVWRELLRRQTRFNQEVVLALSDILGVRGEPPSPPSLEGYAAWCAAREPAEMDAAARAAAALPHRPRFSLVTPVYNTPAPLLRACVQSVLAQCYAEWELLLVDDGSSAPHLPALLEELARRDGRIRVLRLEANGGIARATNAGLAQASGEWVAFLDHDDLLAPHALASVAVRLAEQPTADVVYSDEDRVDLEGRRHAPFFKPGWSPDLLRSVNYICHFVVVRRELLEQAGGLREGFEGSQDYELLLRLSEHTQRFTHVARVLYHWRAHPDSFSQSAQGLTAATQAGVRALQEHLSRRGESASVESPAPTTYRVRYPVRGQPKVSIIVPFKDQPHLLDTLVHSLLEKTSYPHYELLLVSNNSTRPETWALLERLTDPRIVKLRWDFPFNYPAINNWAARQATGELLLFLNNDMEVVEPGWLEELVSQAQRPEVGAVGAKLLFPDGTLQHAGVVVGLTGFAGHPFWRMPDRGQWTPFGHADWARNYLSVTSACVAMRRTLFEELGGFDERFQVCGSDVEIGLRLNARGLRVVYTPQAKLIHHESASRRVDAIPEGDYWLSYSAYRPYLSGGDPYYNPNLTLRGTDCALREDERSGELLAVQTLARDLPGTREPAAAARAREQRHRAEHLAALDCTPQQAQASREEEPRRLQALRARGRLERMTWFLPAFGHPYAGIHTLLRFAEGLQRRHGVDSDFVIYDQPEAHPAQFAARAAPILGRADAPFRVLRRPEEVAELPECDLAVATWWTSAYRVLHHPRAAARAYFIQDFEPLFYPAGTLYALAEQTYRLGFYGIFNGPGLRDYVTSRYPMAGCAFEPTVDSTLFHEHRPARSGPVRVFFYGRPNNDRNAFELGLAALSCLKRELGAAVEIVSAGAPWSPEAYGVRGAINNLGVLPYEQTAALYRECDVGLCFMLTHHPSYLPLEMMACGVTVVTNDNPSNHWLLEHGHNCLLAEPTVSGVVDALRRAVAEEGLRTRLGTHAAARVRRTTWDAEVDGVLAALLARSADARTLAR